MGGGSVRDWEARVKRESRMNAECRMQSGEVRKHLRMCRLSFLTSPLCILHSAFILQTLQMQPDLDLVRHGTNGKR
jgi:hypothetical protein